MPVIICIFTLLCSHLMVDKDFPKEVKTTASVAFVILIIFYILFGVIF